MPSPIIGKSDLNQDFTNVQNALKQAAPGDVIEFQGDFLFGNDSVKVSQAVTIVGVELNGKLPTITGGGNNQGPLGAPVFEVAAPDQSVSIQNLQFISPKLSAIRVSAVDGLVISGCRIQGLLPLPVGPLTTGVGIIVGTQDDDPAKRATSGDLLVSRNQIDTVANSSKNTVGILFNHAGINNDRPAIVVVTENVVTNVSAFGLDFRELRGRATIKENVINMGTIGVSAPGFLISGIRCFGSSKSVAAGQYVVVGNEITCEVETAAGIRLYSKSAVVPLKKAEVKANKISMLMQTGTDILNAGIEVRGHILGSEVKENKISGRARTALSVIQDSQFAPVDTHLKGYSRKKFTPSLADITLAQGVINTQIFGPEDPKAGTIKDLGSINTSVKGGYIEV